MPLRGTPRGDLDKKKIQAATFHPFQDVWWLVWTDPPGIVTVTDGAVSATEECSWDDALKRFMAKHKESP
jgi:hypothetical protein